MQNRTTTISRHVAIALTILVQGCGLSIGAFGGLGNPTPKPVGTPGPSPGATAAPTPGPGASITPTVVPGSPGPTATPAPTPTPASYFRIQAFAGDASGSAGNLGDGAPADAALFSGPAGTAVGPAGEVYFADFSNHVVRKVLNGTVSVVAGWGAFGFAGDGGLARDAQLLRPFGVSAASDGRVAIADYGNDRVRAINSAGIINTVAGGGGATPVTGAEATASALIGPAGVAYALDGSLYIAEFLGHRVLRLDGEGKLTIIAGTGQEGSGGDGGNGPEAQLKQPVAVLPDNRGGCWIADYGNHRVRFVDSVGKIRTVAGTGEAGSNGDGGPADRAQLNGPASLALLQDGTLLIADMGNNKVRGVAPNGAIRTVAGSGKKGNGGDGGPALAADMDSPAGLALRNGETVVADYGNNRLRLLLLE